MEQQNQNGMTEDTLITLLLNRYGKPLIKKAISEYLKENGLAIVPSRHLETGALISTNQAIKMLGGINRQTLYKYIGEGLPALRVGKSYKFRTEELQDFIQGKKCFR